METKHTTQTQNPEPDHDGDTNTESETPAIYGDLHTRTASHTWSPAGANKECATAVETKHTTLARCLEPDQDGDTEEINTGDKTIDNNAKELPNNMARNQTNISKLQGTKHTMPG